VEGGVEAMAEAASPQVGAARARPRPLVVSPGRCPPSSLLLAPWVFWQNRIFAVFSGIFPKSQFSAQKRDTRAILLKTALVRISCIQNTQIRGKTIAKVFGKVDTFWTYQSSPSKVYFQGSPHLYPGVKLVHPSIIYIIIVFVKGRSN
jgi:hypothetical protein